MRISCPSNRKAWNGFSQTQLEKKKMQRGRKGRYMKPAPQRPFSLLPCFDNRKSSHVQAQNLLCYWVPTHPIVKRTIECRELW